MLKIPIGIIVAKVVSLILVAKELESNSTPLIPPTRGKLTQGRMNVIRDKTLTPKMILTNNGVEQEDASGADFDKIDLK
tara:strand:- start:199 stop:435 length:237 start_codon:yes stop_codon:yes gene_type:complete